MFEVDNKASIDGMLREAQVLPVGPPMLQHQSRLTRGRESPHG